METVIVWVLVLVRVYYWLIIIRVLLSWLPVPTSPLLRSVYRFLYDVTEPYLGLFRRLLPSFGRRGIGFDFSPILAIIVLILIETLLRRIG